MALLLRCLACGSLCKSCVDVGENSPTTDHTGDGLHGVITGARGIGSSRSSS